MEHGKQSSSDASSAENDRDQPEKSNEDNTGVGRSYECNFCKRGFTNAQALGGHMNIHRKDKAKAKAKHKNREEPLIIQKMESNVNSRYNNFPQISSHVDQIGYYGYNYIGAHVNYQAYLPPSNPSFQTSNYRSNNSPVWRSDQYYENDHMDENLNLRIGLTPPVEDGDGNAKENEVDLELRLGHDP